MSNSSHLPPNLCLPLGGKKVFITGGSGGIGSSMARIFAQKGAVVAISYSSNEMAARQILSELPGDGHLCFPMDLRNEESIQSTVNDVLQAFGEIDGLVNNAGITKDSLLLRMKSEDFDAVINTNLRGTFLVCKAFLKSMMKARKGSIVNITSVIGQTGNIGQSNYAASKAGIVAFSKSLALEVASRGIRVNCVAPGFVTTEMTASLPEDVKNKIQAQIPMGKVASPEDVAYISAFLVGDESKYITGQTLCVNGGMFMS